MQNTFNPPHVRAIAECPQAEYLAEGTGISFREIFESATDGILILNGKTGCIAEVNASLQELLGYSRAELLGKALDDLEPFRNFLSKEALLQKLGREGCIRHQAWSITTRDGRNLTVEITCNAHGSNGHEVVQCNIRDVSQRAIAENDAQAHRETLAQHVADRTALLQTANEALEAFSYSVSHDLRAPLRQVMGFVKLLQQSAGPALTEKDLRFLRIISESAKRMGNLIDDLLAFSRVGRTEMRKTEVNLEELVQETLGGLGEDIKDRKITWTIRPLPSVWTDRSLMLMVLTNLISNAVKFTGKRDEARIEIGVSPSGNEETIVFIRDNGAGFDQKYVEKLFGVFQRLHSESEFDGTGIGLANVQRIIQRHGGRVWAEGVVEGGATFYFSIPNQTKDSHEN